MRSITKKRSAALAGTAIIAISAVVVSISGATFSDTRSGVITGTIGSVRGETSGGTGTDLLDVSFDNLMPGVAQTATLKYKNVGTGPEDVFLTFPNATALSALNNLGTFGEVHIGSNGTEIFADANLNDKPNNGTVGVPKQILLASNVPVGADGSATFSFNYASKLGTASHSNGGGVFNSYPVAGQVTVNAADGIGSGLPTAIVFEQPGGTP
jgi:hypothetical protein